MEDTLLITLKTYLSRELDFPRLCLTRRDIVLTTSQMLFVGPRQTKRHAQAPMFEVSISPLVSFVQKVGLLRNAIVDDFEIASGVKEAQGDLLIPHDLSQFPERCVPKELSPIESLVDGFKVSREPGPPKNVPNQKRYRTYQMGLSFCFNGSRCYILRVKL